MSITLGFVMRIGSYPPAVAMPPIVQPLQGERQVTKATIITEPEALAGSGISRNDFVLKSHSYTTQQNPPLTYTKKGEHLVDQENQGRLLDMFV